MSASLGKELPEWVPLCVASYLDTGHMVRWWSLEPQFDAGSSYCQHVGSRPGVARASQPCRAKLDGISPILTALAHRVSC